MNEWMKDGGIKSRKLWFAVGATGLIFVGNLIAAKWIGFSANYETMVGGIIGVLTVYLTGNVASRWSAGKTAAPTPNPTPTVASTAKKLSTPPIEESTD